MKPRYEIRNAQTFPWGKFITVSNYEANNTIAMYCFKYLPKKTPSDIGVWKLKKLKQ